MNLIGNLCNTALLIPEDQVAEAVQRLHVFEHIRKEGQESVALMLNMTEAFLAFRRQLKLIEIRRKD
ncbi:MAG: hypothetical protein DRP08_01070 [Candidatus Aenigmatarchaeota archaeon]|nr:MAG: hypothetical protein DRP08_01070 [Candidatus Aenigmarchaeota archaeon]